MTGLNHLTVNEKSYTENLSTLNISFSKETQMKVETLSDE